MKKTALLSVIIVMLAALCLSCGGGFTRESSPGKNYALADDEFYPVERSARYGYVNARGNLLIDFAFRKAGAFREGRAPVFDGRLYGYIDKAGKLVIPYRYKMVTDFNGGRAVVYKSGDYNWAVIDPEGREVAPLLCSHAAGFSEGLAAVRMGALWGFIGADGKFVIPPRYRFAYEFSESLARVSLGKKLGYIDRSGRMVIPPSFREAGPFHDGFAPVLSAGRKKGFINRKGKFAVPPVYNHIGRRFSEGLAAVYKGGRRGSPVIEGGQWGYVDTSGKLVSQPTYADAAVFSCGLAAVRVGNKWGFIDKAGRDVIPFLFAGREGPVFRNGVAVVTLSAGKYTVKKAGGGECSLKVFGYEDYLINTKGEFINP